MPDSIAKCVAALVKAGQSEPAARATAEAQFSDSYRGQFNDRAVYDPKTRQAISVRDGVLQYTGEELGLQPPDHLFTVYRSPATIANVAPKMAGIAITDGHVPLDVPPPGNGGFVSSSEMVDALDTSTHTTLAIRNKLTLADTLDEAVNAGRRELSLGYGAELVRHDLYDFEQRDIEPHHLAAVDQGRCGPMCSFIDRKPNPKEPEKMAKPKFHAAFCDAEGALNLQQIAELVAQLPEAIKSVPVDELQKLLPSLQQVVESAKGALPATPAEGGEEEATKTEMTTDEDPEAMPKEDPNKEKPFADQAAAKGYLDQKAVEARINQHTEVVTKARDFLDASYDYKGKTTEQIMRDALAVESSEQFADSELGLAFKMLKKSSNYQKFGDQGTPGSLSSIADKEI
jgi:hypothetical protein